MSNPLKVNLYLEDEIPKKIFQSGGAIDYKEFSTKKYLRADNKIQKFVDKKYIEESDIILWFEILNNKIGEMPKDYVSRGQKNISFNIKELEQISNVKIKNFINKNLVLKFLDTEEPIEVFIIKWKENKKLFNNVIPNVFMCGQLYKDDVFICNYYITETYFDYVNLLKLDYVYVIDYIVKMLLFLIKCKESGIIFRNFKFSSLGYLFIKEKIEFLIGDYDDKTLISETDEFFNNFSDGCDSMCGGTLVPYFIIKDFFEINTEWKTKLDKIYSVGLGESLIFLLYKQDTTMNDLFKIIYEPSYLKPCLHYYHFMKIFDNVENKTLFYKSISNLQPKFFQLNLQIINPMFIRIIQNCFNIDYTKVKYPQVYLKNIYSVYTKYLDSKNKISTHIKPIGTIDYKIEPTIEKKLESKELAKEITKQPEKFQGYKKPQIPILSTEKNLQKKISFNDKIDYF